MRSLRNFSYLCLAFLLLLSPGALALIVQRIDLPSGLLPQENIFRSSHYRRELQIIFDALGALNSETTKVYTQLRDSALWQAGLILTGGGVGLGIVTLPELFRCWRSGTVT